VAIVVLTDRIRVWFSVRFMITRYGTLLTCRALFSRARSNTTIVS
jgi:hypothetical protein